MDDAIEEIVHRFGLQPHPEGGYFAEIYRSDLRFRHPALLAGEDAERCSATLIYYLLPQSHFSAFHRVRWSDEIWHLYAGGPLEIHVIDHDGRHSKRALTTDPMTGEPAAIVRAGQWQAARPAPGARFAFCGCSVSPGFEFSEFELSPAAELKAAYPDHARLIGELTRA